MDFIKDFNKNTSKEEGVSLSAPKPKFFISLGNYVINKIISGAYRGGLAQGKLAMLAGPSSAGKSFLAGNAIKAAQDQGCGILIIDSENALDEQFLENLGVDVSREDFLYRGVSKISQAIKILSTFLKHYRASGATHPFLIVIDSLDMLSTDSAADAFESGEMKGDQGQHAKQLKNSMTPLMHDIKDLPVVVLCTKQVYKTQDPIAAKNPVTEWNLTEAIKYAFTQIILVTRLMLKDDATKKYEGIRLKVFGLKTRLTKPFQQAVIEVPYDTGMDPFSGLLEVAEAVGVVTKAGSWYAFNGNKFQSKDFSKHQEAVLEELIKIERDTKLEVVPEDEDTVVEAGDKAGAQAAVSKARAAKAAAED